MAEVSILLATYNGAAYLPEQLESIAAQRGDIAWTLLWRDDGSSDGTPALLDAFGQRGGAVRRVTEPAGRAGAARSFLALLAAAPESDGYAFCDQDDVWLPDKLERAMRALSAAPAGRPAIYCGRQRLVDAALRPIGFSPLPRRPLGFSNALVQNVVTGCTAVLNPAARRLLLAAPAIPAGSMHDWWCYLLVTGAGGMVIFDPEPAMLYRQHGANVVGSQGSVLHRALGAFRRGAKAFLDVFDAHLAALEQARPLLSPEALRVLDALRDIHAAGPAERLARLRRAGLYRQGLLEDLVLRFWFLAARQAVPGRPAVSPGAPSQPR